jgi:hypothetical protein
LSQLTAGLIPLKIWQDSKIERIALVSLVTKM